MSCWLSESVTECDEVRPNCVANGKQCTSRAYSRSAPRNTSHKGSVAFEGSFASGQNSNGAVFGELAPSTSLMSASKVIDINGCPLGWTTKQPDTQQADTQSEMQGAETWIFLPSDQWPKGCNAKFRIPLVKLRSALYGHPLSAAFWERHCTDKLRSVGVSPVTNGGPTFVHKHLQMILSVYSDDFQMAGPENNLKNAWSLTRDVIAMDDPTNPSKYLGCVHETHFGFS